MTLRILREPAPEHPLLLLEHLKDTPETGESEAAQDGGDGLVWHEQGHRRDQKSYDEPDPPTLFPKMVLHLDDGWVSDTDSEEYCCTDKDTAEVNCLSVS